VQIYCLIGVIIGLQLRVMTVANKMWGKYDL